MEYDETGWVGQGVDELAVGKLLDAHDTHVNDGAQEAGKGRAEIAGEAVVDRAEGADMVLADAFRAFEVVGAYVAAGAQVGLECGAGPGGARAAAGRAGVGLGAVILSHGR